MHRCIDVQMHKKLRRTLYPGSINKLPFSETTFGSNIPYTANPRPDAFFCKKVVYWSRLPNLVVITFLENYACFVNTLDTIGNQWEIFVYRFDLPVTSLYNNDIC